MLLARNCPTIIFVCFLVMREWSLFALRNILEGNLDNQNFVANIDSVGSTDCESSVMVSDPLGMTTIKNSTSNSDTMFI